MPEAVITSACRTAVGKAPRGSLRNVRPDDLAALVLRSAIERVPHLSGEDVDDVIFGCAYPEAQQGRNLARMAALRAGLPVRVAGATVNRLCASGLEAIALASARIEAGWAEVIVAGGVESMSAIPRGGHAPSPNPTLVERYPDAYLSMGLTAERVVQRYGISREDQDAFALESHRRAAAAIASGRFQPEIVPVNVLEDRFESSERTVSSRRFSVDEGVRTDASAEGLAALRPVFKKGGTVTAGNSSQTSDGAAAVVVMSRAAARRFAAPPLGRLAAYCVAGCEPEVMGIGPVAAVPRALDAAGRSLSEIELIELNEAFACQALAVARELGFNRDRLNVNGGAIALGHPLGATGAKLTVSLLYEMARRRLRVGMVTMCIGGGMGAAGIFEIEDVSRRS